MGKNYRKKQLNGYLGRNNMTNEAKIAILAGRRKLLLTRGIHNAKIAAKIARKIRQLGGTVTE